MKKKTLATRLMSVLLSAAVVVTSSNGSVLLMDARAEHVSEKSVSVNSSEDSAETEADETTEPAAETAAEEDSEATTADAGEESVGDNRDVSGDEAAGADDEKIVDDEDLETDAKAINQDAVVTELDGMDDRLAEALLEIYNTQNENKLTMGQFKQSHLSQITEVDLSKAADERLDADLSRIDSCEGIGYLDMATFIDLSGTSVTKIAASEFRLTDTNVKDKTPALETIILPDGVKAIGTDAFRDCKNLVNINTLVGDTVSENTLPSSLKDTENYEQLMGSSVFRGCTSIKKIIIPELANGVALQNATDMFRGCTGLEEVYISASVESLPVNAFYQAGNEEDGMKVTFAENSQLNLIQDGAFRGANMAFIDLSNCKKLAGIGAGVFSSCVNKTTTAQSDISKVKLGSIKMPERESGSDISMTIGMDAFLKTPLTSMYTGTDEGKVIIPDYVTAIGTGAFYKNEAMTAVQLPARLGAVEAYTFDGCKELTTVTQSTELIDGKENCAVQYIGNAAFRDTVALKSGEFVGKMNQLTHIGEEKLAVVDKTVQKLDYTKERTAGANYGSDVFRNSGITNVTLPASLRTINSRSFYEAINLTDVEWLSSGDALEQGAGFFINSEAFALSPVVKFIYPATAGKGASFEIGQWAFYKCTELVNFSEQGTDNEDGMHSALPVTLEKLEQEAFLYCTALKSMKITNNEQEKAPSLGKAAFGGCHNLEVAVLPLAITEIPAEFFYDSDLREFPKFAALDGKETTENQVQKINDAAFFGSGMETLDIHHLKYLTHIGNYAFAYHNETKNNNTQLEPDAIEITEFHYASLKKAILPDKVYTPQNKETAMTWGTDIFYFALDFTTLATETKGADNVVYIPQYISVCGAGVFGNTAVSKAEWGFLAAVASGSPCYEWKKIPDSMFFGTELASLEDCCLPAEYLEEIGDQSYAFCMNLTEVDLSPYTNLKTTGMGTFSNCRKLKKIVLPTNDYYTKTSVSMFQVGFTAKLTGGLGESYYSSLEEIDFGGVTELADYTFASCNSASTTGEKPIDTTWPSALAQVDLRESKVTVIGQKAFEGNGSLTTVHLGSVEKLMNGAFERCGQLNMTDTPLPDTLKEIGAKAFYKDSSLGKVTFGSGITQIGESAFEECGVIGKDSKNRDYMEENTGLAEVDFSQAVNLKKIGKKAFCKSGLVTFDISRTQVDNLDTNTLSDCPFLKEVVLNQGLQQVIGNSMSGCIALDKVTFYSTTTMSKSAFQAQGAFKTDENIKGTTPVGSITFELKPVELNVGVGSTMKFPYYVNQVSNEIFEGLSAINIGSSETEGQPVYEYVKVSAKTNGYYYNRRTTGEEGNLVTDSRYYEYISDTSKLKYNINNTSVYTFDIEGLKATPEGTTIPFTINSKFVFLSGDDNQPVDNTIEVTYQMKVVGIDYAPVIYADSSRITGVEGMQMNSTTGTGACETSIRVGGTNVYTVAKNYYYDIQPMIVTNSQPKSGNLIIKTSNPEVMTVGGGYIVKNVDANTWRVEAPFTAQANTVTKATQGKYFNLKPTGHGDATIMIYPEESPEQVITWKFHVRTDIQRINLTIPSEYNRGMQPGDTFSILSEVYMYLGKVVRARDNTLGNLAQYTDNKIVFTSSNPQIASVDGNGMVTIKQVTGTRQPVIFTASAQTKDGKKVEQTVTCNVVYPPIVTNREVQDTSGASIKVTSTSQTGGVTTGKVTYVKPAVNATAVTVPATVVVNGVTCVVTDIADDAFKGNKNLKSVVIGSGVEKVKKDAFKGCSNLQTVTIQGNITEIGESAFEGCTSLTAVSIPNTTTKIGKRAFYNCKKMTKVTISSSAKVTEIGESAFQNCASLKSITIPNVVTSIGKKAFYNCKKLSKVTISSTKSKLTRIGESAFQNCIVLTKITIPKKVTAVDKKAFSGCKKLKTVTFSSSAALLTIGESAFASCAVLTKITIPKKVTSIGSKAFYNCKKLKTITVKSASLRAVGANAFKGIYKNATITVPKTKKDAYKNLFRGKGQSSKVKIK